MHMQDQKLGEVGPYTVGVLHVERKDQANQFIMLQVQDQALSWMLTALEQKFVYASSGSGELISIDQSQLPDITMKGPETSEYNKQVGFFKYTPGRPPAGYKAQYVFLKMDYPAKVVLISQAQYIAIAG